MGARKYTDEQWANALELFRTKGSRPAARETGIPEGQIRAKAASRGIRSEAVEINRAATEAMQAINGRRRENIRSDLLVQAQGVLSRLEQPYVEKKVLADGEVVSVRHERPPAGACRDLSVSVGILIDKFRLEMGELTGRGEKGVAPDVPEEQIDRDLGRLATVVSIAR